MCNGRFRPFKYDNDNTYEGEWLNGKKHRQDIFTWSTKDR